MSFSTRLIVAVLIAMLAAFFVSRWLGMGSTPAPSGPPVVFAANAIEAGFPLDNKDNKQLTIMPWTGHTAPPGSFSDTKKLSTRVTRQKIYPGEPILEGKLAPEGVSAGLAATLTPGKRAITVRVNDVIGVAGFALPGSFVDILVSMKPPNDEAFSKVVLARVKVLAVAQETVTDDAKPKVVNAVTLELSPEEAEKLDLARTVGTLSLVLRNEMDQDQAESKGVYFSDLTGTKRVSTAVRKEDRKANHAAAPRKVQHNPAPPPPQVAPPPPQVEVIRGLTRSKEWQ